jgi:carbon monoxide dehydrogenase subunit G
VLIDHRISVPAPPAAVWALLMDVPAVSRCVPGLQDVEQVDETTYRGVLHVRVGPIQVRLAGQVVLAERDVAASRARMDLQAADKRVNGAVDAKLRLQLAPARAGQATDVAIQTEANVMGKLGELGQPIIRKKADQLVQEFSHNLAATLTTAKP